MNFGDYLKEKLLEKEVSLSVLSEQMGVKSRSALYRMFDGRCSYSKASELFSKITENVKFSEEEKRNCIKLMEDLKTERFYIETRKILSSIYKEETEKGFPHGKNTLSDILEKCDRGGGTQKS